MSSKRGVTENSNATCDMLATFKVELENPSYSRYTTALPNRPPTRASSNASAITETTTGMFEKPSDRNVPISTERVLTDEHMVLMDAIIATTPAMPTTMIEDEC